jgi:orotidine-5'-phosphate decarboxylase
MKDRNFRELLEARWATDRFVCVGLDSEFPKIPKATHKSGLECKISVANTIVAFNRDIIEATHEFACAFKPNIAFYAAYGDEGLAALHRTITVIHTIAPEVPVILDAKRADIGNTNLGYVQESFGFLRADAVTVHPYLGAEALTPFLEMKDKGVIVLCRTSNSGAKEFQDLMVTLPGNLHRHVPLYQYVAHQVATEWNNNGNCAVVVGATYPEELVQVRKIIGDMPILIPGVGAQGGDVEAIVKAGMDSRGMGMIINSSRGIIFASKETDFADAARREAKKLNGLINQYRGVSV